MKNNNSTQSNKKSTSQAGKGDKQRPMQISYDQYVANWNEIFGNKNKKNKKNKEIILSVDDVTKSLKDHADSLDK